MADHLSALELDIAVSGGTLAPDRTAHLGECGDCKQKLERERSAADAVRSRPEFSATLARLSSQPSVGAKVIPLWRRAPVLMTAALAAAAALVMIINPPTADDSRLKGSANVELIGETSHAVKSAKVGERLQLALGAAGKPYAMVLGVDEHGAVDAVWPLSGQRSGPAPKGARTVVSGFEVTEGSLTLVALYSDQPLELGEASKTLAGALKDGKVPATLELPGIVTATAHLEVSK